MNFKYLLLGLFVTCSMICVSSVPNQSVLSSGPLSNQTVCDLAHIPAYGLLTLLWLKVFDRKRDTGQFLRVNTLILAGLLLFAVSDEIHQSFTPGRLASWMDVGLDVVGIFLGLSLFKVRTYRVPRAKFTTK